MKGLDLGHITVVIHKTRENMDDDTAKSTYHTDAQQAVASGISRLVRVRL